MKSNNSVGQKQNLSLKHIEKVIDKKQNYIGKRNSILGIAIILLNICLLGVLWAIESNKVDTVSFKEFFETFDFNFIYLLLIIIVSIHIFKVFSDFLMLYSLKKQRRFWVFIKANKVRDYYNQLSFYSEGSNIMYMNTLINSGIDKDVVSDLAYGKSFLSKISKLLYSFVVLFIGIILCFSGEIIFIFLASILSFIMLCIAILFILYMGKYKDKCLYMLAKFSKILYNLRIVKDYENFYNYVVEKLVITNSILKSKKITIITNIITNIITYFLKHVLIFVILKALNFVDSNVFIDILFRATLLDLILDLLPLGNGSLLFGLIFINLFGSVFFEGYVLWALLIYRILDYFIHIVCYLFVKLGDLIILKISPNIQEKEDV